MDSGGGSVRAAARGIRGGDLGHTQRHGGQLLAVDDDGESVFAGYAQLHALEVEHGLERHRRRGGLEIPLRIRLDRHRLEEWSARAVLRADFYRVGAARLSGREL